MHYLSKAWLCFAKIVYDIGSKLFRPNNFNQIIRWKGGPDSGKRQISFLTFRPHSISSSNVKRLNGSENGKEVKRKRFNKNIKVTDNDETFETDEKLRNCCFLKNRLNLKIQVTLYNIDYKQLMHLNRCIFTLYFVSLKSLSSKVSSLMEKSWKCYAMF